MFGKTLALFPRHYINIGLLCCVQGRSLLFIFSFQKAFNLFLVLLLVWGNGVDDNFLLLFTCKYNVSCFCCCGLGSVLQLFFYLRALSHKRFKAKHFINFNNQRIKLFPLLLPRGEATMSYLEYRKLSGKKNSINTMLHASCWLFISAFRLIAFSFLLLCQWMLL